MHIDRIALCVLQRFLDAVISLIIKPCQMFRPISNIRRHSGSYDVICPYLYVRMTSFCDYSMADKSRRDFHRLLQLGAWDFQCSCPKRTFHFRRPPKEPLLTSTAGQQQQQQRHEESSSSSSAVVKSSHSQTSYFQFNCSRLCSCDFQYELDQTSGQGRVSLRHSSCGGGLDQQQASRWTTRLHPHSQPHLERTGNGKEEAAFPLRRLTLSAPGAGAGSGDGNSLASGDNCFRSISSAELRHVCSLDDVISASPL